MTGARTAGTSLLVASGLNFFGAGLMGSHAGTQQFRIAVVFLLLAPIAELVAVWALYRVTRPVNQELSMLAAWLGVAYAAVTAAIAGDLAAATTSPGTVRDAIAAGLVAGAAGGVLYGVYLALIGYLFYTSRRVPRWLAVLLMVMGGTGLVTELTRIVLVELPSGVEFVALMTLVVGELILVGWLLARGSQIEERLSA